MILINQPTKIVRVCVCVCVCVYWQSVSEKSIRRRIYDILNVLVALNVVRRDSKGIRWIGYEAKRAKEMVKVVLKYECHTFSLLDFSYLLSVCTKSLDHCTCMYAVKTKKCDIPIPISNISSFLFLSSSSLIKQN